MSANCIRFDQEAGTFEFDGIDGYSHVRVEDQPEGRVLVLSLSQRAEAAARRITPASTVGDIMDAQRDAGPMHQKQAFTFAAIGQLIGWAHRDRAKWIRVGEGKGAVTPSYLFKMLGFTSRYGWFFDVLDDTMDHKWDSNNPTPGGYVGEAKRLIAEARQADRNAGLMRGVWRTTEADEFAAKARDKRRTARRLLYREGGGFAA